MATTRGIFRYWTIAPLLRCCSLLKETNSCIQYRYFGNKTIYGLSSGQGRAGIAVIRVSGPDVFQIFGQLTKLKKLPEPRTAVLAKFFDPETGEVIDKGILLWFKEPTSFTGEDCCELHIHGGPATISAVLTALSKLKGFRQSEPGEFTKRAFLNGKLDLTAVEGLADLIQAETEAQRKQALRQMNGELHHLITTWREKIIKLLAYVEAYIDFSEDENIEENLLDLVKKEVKVLIKDIRSHLSDNRRGERLRNGIHVTILGSPNVGKSSLLNHICQKPAAIVSPIAGTTRDVVECAVNIGGYPALFSDTAGLHVSNNIIEQEGMKRAVAHASQADLLIVMLDTLIIQHHSYQKFESVNEMLNATLQNLGLDTLNKLFMASQEKGKSTNQKPAEFTDDPVPIRTMIVINKMDLMSGSLPDYLMRESCDIDLCTVSCLSGYGMQHFMDKLKSAMQNLCSNATNVSPSLTRTRHRVHLHKCVDHLQAYLTLQDTDTVLAAYELRKSARQLGKISGEITSEQILDVIFKDFCIGK